MKKAYLFAARQVPAFLLIVVAGCSGGEKTAAPPVATSITANSSVSLAGTAGAPVTPPPSVVTKDESGSPIGGVTVTFSVVSGGGSVSGATVISNNSGIATVGSWTLGPTVGTNVLNATSGSAAAVAFTATSTPGAPAALVKSDGDNQSAPAASAVPVRPSVIVKDANGNPVSGVSVTFAVVSGGGSVTGATTSTNAAGIATVGSWTLGPVVGANSLSATSGSLAAVTFTATSGAGAAASLAKNAGDNQAATAGSAVATPPSVIVKDASGNPRAGVTVTFTVTSGGGSVTGATVSTSASGIATVGSWTLGSVAGVNTLTASSASLNSVTFTATSSAGAAASIAKNAGDGQSATAGTAVAVPPSVIVKDALGNPKSGVSVTFAVVSGGGSITGATTTTDGSGLASVGGWILGSTAGTNTLSATVSGLPVVTFTATGTAAPSLCASQGSHTFGTISSGTLASGDCQLADGSFVDFYTTSVPQAGAYVFREGAGFDTYLLLAAPDGTTVAENDDETDTGTNSGIKALLPAGNFLIGASSFAPGVTGDYQISSATAATDVSNCEQVFVVRNISTAQNLATTDCNTAAAGATPMYADGYFIFLSAGTSVTITMSSTTIDSFLQLVRIDGVSMAQNDNIDGTTKDARITFTATQSNYYVIFARSVPTTSTGPYTLTIQ